MRDTLLTKRRHDYIALLDSNGNVVVKYVYDAWGNHGVEVVNSACATLANLNPFRYRSYYYDPETELYYLQTRYYDPEIGRFITIDGVEYIDPETINGLNLYAYCGNNPTNYLDPKGNAKWWQWLLFGIGAALVVAAAVVLTVATGGAATGLIGAIAVGAAKGALIGAAVGSVVGIAGGAIYAGVTGADMGQSILSGFLMGFGIGAIVGAVIGGAAGGISYMRSTTALYRAVDINEYNSIKTSGKFSLKEGAFEGKQFGLKLNEVRNYAKLDFNKGVYSKIVKTRIPNSVFNQLSKSSIDAFVFKSGVITVEASKLELLNNALILLKFFGI